MYGLIEYALIREELHRQNRSRKVPKEFDLALTNQAPSGRRKLQRMLNIVKYRRKIRLYLRLYL